MASPSIQSWTVMFPNPNRELFVPKPKPRRKVATYWKVLTLICGFAIGLNVKGSHWQQTGLLLLLSDWNGHRVTWTFAFLFQKGISSSHWAKLFLKKNLCFLRSCTTILQVESNESVSINHTAKDRVACCAHLPLKETFLCVNTCRTSSCANYHISMLTQGTNDGKHCTCLTPAC